MQIVLFLFNLIPAYPLDGGRLLGALLQGLGVDRNKSFQISAVIGGVSENVVCCDLLTLSVDNWMDYDVLCIRLHIQIILYVFWRLESSVSFHIYSVQLLRAVEARYGWNGNVSSWL